MWNFNENLLIWAYKEIIHQRKSPFEPAKLKRKIFFLTIFLFSFLFSWCIWKISNDKSLQISSEIYKKHQIQYCLCKHCEFNVNITLERDLSTLPFESLLSSKKTSLWFRLPIIWGHNLIFTFPHKELLKLNWKFSFSFI